MTKQKGLTSKFFVSFVFAFLTGVITDLFIQTGAGGWAGFVVFGNGTGLAIYMTLCQKKRLVILQGAYLFAGLVLSAKWVDLKFISDSHVPTKEAIVATLAFLTVLGFIVVERIGAARNTAKVS